MTEFTSGAGAVVEGVDLDAVVAAVRSCAGVDDLTSGAWGGVVTYLPGRQVPGVRVASDHVVISLRGRWGVPAAEIARQVLAAVADLVAPRNVDLVLADVSDPAPETGARRRRAGHPAFGVRSGEVSSWTTSSGADEPGANSSVLVIQTVAVIPPRSPPD
jgi:hypothetical protein